MSKARNQANAGEIVKEDPPFEESLKRLEEIVEAMESEDLTLEQMLAKYEEGVKLNEQCQAKLRAAEVRLRVIEKKPGGDIEARPMSSPENAVQE